MTISEPTIVRFEGDGRIEPATGEHGIVVTCSDVTIVDPVVTGAGSTIVRQDTNRTSGILLQGRPGVPIERIEVRGGRIEAFSYAGIRAEYVADLAISSVQVRDIAYAGVQMLSVVGGSVSGCTIAGLRQQAYPNSYGICATRDTGLAIGPAPRCSDIDIVGNHVSDVPEWEGIGTHGGERIVIRDNSVTDCATGIALVPLKSERGGPTDAAPRDCVVTGNTVRWTRALDDAPAMRAGINFVGSGEDVGSSAERATGAIRDNVVSGYGNAGMQTASILVYFTERLAIERNHIESGNARGVLLLHSNADVLVAGNTTDRLAAAGKQSYTSAFDVRLGANGVTFLDNRVFVQQARDPEHLRYGVYAPGSGSTISLRPTTADDWRDTDVLLAPAAQRNTIVWLG